MDIVLIFLSIYVFVVGLCFGSFLNVVIWRTPQGLSFAKGRSFCPHCHHTLVWYDLIPLVSWLILRGKCRSCKEPISIRYPLIECASGVLALWCFSHYGFTWDTILVFIIALLLLAVAMIDLDTMLIPNGLLLTMLIPIIILCMLHPEVVFLDRFIGCFSIALPMYILTLLIPNCFGGGDIKLLAVCGIVLGWKLSILAIFIAILLGGFYACYLLISKKAQKSSHIAFGPYICVGVFISLLYGIDLITAYFSFFGLMI